MSIACVFLSWSSFSECFKLINDFSKKTCLQSKQGNHVKIVSLRSSLIEVEVCA